MIDRKGDFILARHKVEIANVNTANIKVLTQEEMIELFQNYQNGLEEAKEELIRGNLKLVLSILKRYNNRTDNMDDLFQVGCIGCEYVCLCVCVCMSVICEYVCMCGCVCV